MGVPFWPCSSPVRSVIVVQSGNMGLVPFTFSSSIYKPARKKCCFTLTPCIYLPIPYILMDLCSFLSFSLYFGGCVLSTIAYYTQNFTVFLKYSETCLIRPALREKLCVRIDRVSDYTVLNTKEMVKSVWKSVSD